MANENLTNQDIRQEIKSTLLDNLSATVDSVEIEYDNERVANEFSNFLNMVNDPTVNEMAIQGQGIEKRSRKKKNSDDIEETGFLDEDYVPNNNVSVRRNNLFSVEFTNFDIDANYIADCAEYLNDYVNKPSLTFSMYAYTKFDEDKNPHTLLKSLMNYITTKEKTDIILCTFDGEGTIISRHVFKDCIIQRVYNIDPYDYSNSDLSMFSVIVEAESLDIDF